MTLDKAQSLANDISCVIATLQAIADNLLMVNPDSGSDRDKPGPDSLPTKQAKAKTKTISLEVVRTVLAEKSRDGHTAKVRALLEKYSGSKLSEISPDHYAELLKEAEGIK